MAKTVTQAYGATLIVGGAPVAPGTPIPLPEDEAVHIASIFGVVPAIHEPVKVVAAKKARASSTDSDTKGSAVDIAALEQAVASAQADYDEAKTALEAEDAGDDEAKAFEEAEAALAGAEEALARAKG